MIEFVTRQLKFVIAMSSEVVYTRLGGSCGVGGNDAAVSGGGKCDEGRPVDLLWMRQYSLFSKMRDFLFRWLLKSFLLILYLKEKALYFCKNTLKNLFEKLGKSIQRIPTWLFITGAVTILSLVAIWVEDDIKVQSPRDLVKILFNNAESIAVVAAVILYFKEFPERKAQRHYEAWQVIDSAAAARVPTSQARFKALEDLNQEGVSLNGVVMPQANLQNINLRCAAMTDADLADADLSEANLFEAKLSRANLKRAKLSQANLSNSDLTGANLTEAKLTGAKLKGAKLAGAKLTGAKLPGADLTGASLTGTDLSSANLFRAVLSYASLYEADLTGGDFQGANFTEAKLFGANITNANLTGAIGLSLKEIRDAKNWQNAIYDAEFCIQLGLPQVDNTEG